MSTRTPISAPAVEEIKLLAKRFSKELQILTGQRIKGIKLYDSFVKTLGYESLNEVNSQSGRTNANFSMKSYIEVLHRELKRHLPIDTEEAIVKDALVKAENAGSVLLKIDGINASTSSVTTLVNSEFYKDFRSHVINEGRKRYIQFNELLNSMDNPTTQPLTGNIVITLDYSRWKNENDPFFDWDMFNSFIRDIDHLNNFIKMADDFNNSVGIQVIRITKDIKSEQLKGFNEYGIPEWMPYIHY